MPLSGEQVSEVEGVVRRMLASPQGLLGAQFFPLLGAGRNQTGRVPGCRVYHNTTQSSPNGGAFTAMTFNSERYDTDDMHSTTTNPTRITCRTPGRYTIGGSLVTSNAADSSGDYRSLYIILNGAVGIAQSTVRPIAATVAVALNVYAEYQLAAGDYVELHTRHNATGSLTIPASNANECEFWAGLTGNF